MRLGGWMLVFGGLLAMGCAQRTLTITSDPPGAEAVVNDQLLGRTPVTTDFIDYGNYEVILRREGYQTLKTSASVNPPWYMFPVIDLFSEMMPWHVKDHHDVHFVLQPAATQPNPGELLAHAAELRADLRSSEHTRPPSTKPATTKAASTKHAKDTKR